MTLFGSKLVWPADGQCSMTRQATIFRAPLSGYRIVSRGLCLMVHSNDGLP